MKTINKAAVNHLYRLLYMKEHDPERYLRNIQYGNDCARNWDDPEEVKPKVLG